VGNRPLRLWNIANADLPDAATAGRGSIAFDTTNNAIYYVNNSDAWATAGGGSTTFTGLTDSPANFAAAGDKIVKVNTGATALEFVTMSGDVSINATGVAAIGSGVIVNADVNASAAIAWSKMAAVTDVDTSGNVVDLTMSGEAQGNVLYRGASAWAVLAPGTSGQALITSGAGANPYWGAPSVSNASSLANSVTCEAGASDYTLAFGTAGGAYTLTVPAVGGARTFAFINEAQTFSAVQTFAQSGVLLQGGDANALIPRANETLTANRTLNVVVNDADRTVDLTGNLTIVGNFTTAGAWTHTGAHTLGITTSANTAITLPTTGTLATLAGAEVLSSKTLTLPQINDTSSDHQYIFAVNELAADRTVTLPLLTGDDTFVFNDFAATLTNKTIDADSNTVSNVNGDELDPVAVPSAGNASDTVYGVPVIFEAYISNQAAAVNIYNANAPFKFRIVRCWSINRSADGGTWKLNNGAAGAGTDITNAVTVAANDEDIDEPTDYNDAVLSIAASGSLSIVPDGAGLLDCSIFIEAIRVD